MGDHVQAPCTQADRTSSLAGVKATRDAFEAAIAPVLADLDRQHPGLFRLAIEPEDSDLQAWLWEGDGSGTGVYLDDGWDSDVDAFGRTGGPGSGSRDRSRLVSHGQQQLAGLSRAPRRRPAGSRPTRERALLVLPL